MYPLEMPKRGKREYLESDHEMLSSIASNKMG
jgi:hypothetical protein